MYAQSAVRIRIRMHIPMSVKVVSMLKYVDPEKFQIALEHLKAQSLHYVNSIKYFNFSTLYTAIHHDKLKVKIKSNYQSLLLSQEW